MKLIIQNGWLHFISNCTSNVHGMFSRCNCLNWWVLYDQLIILFVCGLPDLHHICQNLNQFGHGRGTIYGGKKCFQVHQYSNIIVIRISDSNLLDVFSAGFAQYTIIPARYCYKLKTNLDVNRACLLERKKLYMQISSLRFIVVNYCDYNIRVAKILISHVI